MVGSKQHERCQSAFIALNVVGRNPRFGGRAPRGSCRDGMGDHEVRSELAMLYRRFTDQLMTSLATLGAP